MFDVFTNLANVVDVVFSDGLSCQTLERHVCLGLEDDLRHSSGGCCQRSLTSSVDTVNVSSSLQQRHHNGVESEEVRDNLPVGDDDVERSVLGSVHCLGICSGLE